MKRALGFWILVLSSAQAFALAPGSASDAEVARAFRLAYTGELTKAPLVRALDIRFHSTQSATDKIQCGYLLTFSPRRMLQDSQLNYVNAVLKNEQSPAVLGEQSLLRLYRIRGDAAYDSGKFEQAAQDHTKLLQSTESTVREYAILKIGWSYLNLKTPQRAFTFWMDHARQAVEQGAKQISPNLFHGIGFALVENTQRSEKDFTTATSLDVDAALVQQFALGVSEGLDSLKTDAEQEALALQASALPNLDSFTRSLFENSKASGKRSCRLVYWLQSPKVDLQWPVHGKSLESCAQWASRTDDKEKRDPKFLALLEGTLTRATLAGGDRRVRFEFFRSQRKGTQACLEGVEWLTDELDETQRKTAPVKEIAENCVAAAPRFTPEEMDRVTNLSRKSAEDFGFLQTAGDPLLFVLTALLPQAGARKALVKTLVANPSAFSATLLPTVLAESLRKNRERDAANRIFSVYGASKAGQARKEAIWQNLLDDRVSTELAANRTPGALEDLKKALPIPADAPLTESQTELWLSAILKAKQAPEAMDSARASLAALFANGSATAHPKLTSAVLELGGSYGLWSEVWAALQQPKGPGFSRIASERLKMDLFEAISSGRWKRPAKAVADPELRFLVTLADGIRSEKLPSILAVVPVGKSAISKDQSTLKEISQKANEILSPGMSRRDRITQVTNWVSFVTGQSRKVARRSWSQPSLSRAASQTLADFCREARGRLRTMGEVSKHKADSKEQWQTFVPILLERLNDCEKRGNS